MFVLKSGYQLLQKIIVQNKLNPKYLQKSPSLGTARFVSNNLLRTRTFPTGESNELVQNVMVNKILQNSPLLDTARSIGNKLLKARAFSTSESNKAELTNSPVKRTTCTLIPGDGVYPELMESVKAVLNAIGTPVDFETIYFSQVEKCCTAKVEDVIESINRNKICLMGSITNPYGIKSEDDGQNLHMQLRKGLDLYSNEVHVKSLPGVVTKHKDIDMVIIRELTEGEYSGLEHESVPNVVEHLKVTTAKKSRRIAKFAFDYAIRNNRKHVTCVHKANIMKLGDGLFLKSCSEVAKMYPDIKLNEMIVDNCVMQMVHNPHQFDVLVMPNLYGNILTNLAAGLVGGAGVVGSSSFSPECAVFEPAARHSFQIAVGKNIANPAAILMCASKMLRHVNLMDHSVAVYTGVKKVLAAGQVRTIDLGGSSTTHEFTDAVIKCIT